MPCQTKLMWKYNWNRSLAFLELFNSTVEKRQKKVFKIICSLSLVMSGWCGSFKRELMWHFFLGQSTALTWRASQAHTLFLFPSHFFLFFFQTPPFSLSHLYPHISCSSTNKSCKVNVSVERLPYMKTNEQVHSVLRLIFPPTEFFFSSTNFVLISHGRWIYPPAPLPE